MRCVRLIALVALLGGCTSGDRLALEAAQEPSTAHATPGACDTVRSHATSVGEDFTRGLADEAILHHIAESRGMLIQSGRRRVRIAERRTTCAEHIYLGPGLQEYHCLAEARICGS